MILSPFRSEKIFLAAKYENQNTALYRVLSFFNFRPNLCASLTDGGSRSGGKKIAPRISRRARFTIS
jgi:hypothetical protein